GRVFKTYGPYREDTSPPGAALFAPTGDGAVPTVNRDEFDGVGRTTAVIFSVYGSEKWRTTTAYHGDRVDVTPPEGGTATTTLSDAQGLTTQLRQYHDPADVGSADPATYDATSYGYDNAKQL